MKIERTLTPDDRATGPYLPLPFEVPAGAGAVAVRLRYDRTAGVVDLGCDGAAGFRGWSGGARDRFGIGPDAATPGYLPGELEPGEWSVVLGLHRIPASGLNVAVDVAFSAATPAEPEPPHPPVPARRPRRALPAPAGLTWLAADFHAHTHHSDGSLGVAELAAAAVEAGLDVLAVTDHNTVSHHRLLPEAAARYGVTLLPGQEVTTDRGHANAFGAIRWVDFRRPASDWVAQVREDGGLLSINHPLAADCAWHQPLPERPPLAEIWHSTWDDRTWTYPLAWWTAWGLSTVPVGGSDFHRPDEGRPVGEPVTWVAAVSPEPADVLEALRAGRTALSPGLDAPVLLRVDDELVALDADGLLLVDTAGRRRPVRGDHARFPAAPGPHRLETPLAAVAAISP
jgi:hypothetical protein